MTKLRWLPAPSEPNPVGAQEFVLEGAEGQRPVTGALWLPDNLATTEAANAPSAELARRPMVLLGHGASGDRYQAPLPHLAKRFTQEYGFTLLAIDGPVHGLRQVGDGARGAFFVEMQRTGFIDDMVDDWQLAFTQVCASKGVGQGPLGYFGLSMGTIFGVPLLASSLNFSVATIGLCGLSGAAATIAERLARDAQRIEHPILFLMQLEDELFDRLGCLGLFDALAAQDKRLHANPGRHPEVPAEEIAHSVEFIGARLSSGMPVAARGGVGGYGE